MENERAPSSEEPLAAIFLGTEREERKEWLRHSSEKKMNGNEFFANKKSVSKVEDTSLRHIEEKSLYF